MFDWLSDDEMKQCSSETRARAVQTQTNQSSRNSGKLYIDSQLKDISVGQKCASMTLLFLKVICVLVFVRHCLAKKNGENDYSIPCEGLLKVWLRGGRFYR